MLHVIHVGLHNEPGSILWHQFHDRDICFLAGSLTKRLHLVVDGPAEPGHGGEILVSEVVHELAAVPPEERVVHLHDHGHVEVPEDTA